MKDKQKYLIIPYHQGYTLSKQLLSQVAQLLGYKVIIGKPTDTCRGRRANNIIWYDEDEDVFKVKELNLPLDKPLEPCYNIIINSTIKKEN